MILDVSELTDFSVDVATKIATFGTGFTGAAHPVQMALLVAGQSPSPHPSHTHTPPLPSPPSSWQPLALGVLWLWVSFGSAHTPEKTPRHEACSQQLRYRL